MQKRSTQLFSEPNTNGERDMLAPITTSDEVIVNNDLDNPITLTEKLNELTPGIVVSASKPAHACLWAKTL